MASKRELQRRVDELEEKLAQARCLIDAALGLEDDDDDENESADED